MRRRLMVRAATLLLALLIPLAGVRAASAPSCIDEDCDMPCCTHDANNATVLPVLPCCRTVSMDQAAAHPAPTTVENDHFPVIAPTSVSSSLVTVAIDVSSTAPSAIDLPAPPLYQQHCALLL
jgi:hypothetical protein